MSNKLQATLIEINSALLIFLFVYTAISKFTEFNLFKAFLSQSPLIGDMYIMVAWMLPILELIIAFLLFIPNTRLIGLYSSFGLMVLFTLYLGYMLFFVSERPCNCGGVLKKMTWEQHLIFNIFFVVIAASGILLKRKQFKQGLESKPGYTVFI